MKPTELAQHFEKFMEQNGIPILAYDLSMQVDTKPEVYLLTNQQGLEKIMGIFGREPETLADGTSKRIGKIEMDDKYSLEVECFDD